MSESAYRLGKTILLFILTLGILVIGWRASQMGRYVQYDYGKRFSPDGSSSLGSNSSILIDTWTGQEKGVTRDQ